MVILPIQLREIDIKDTKLVETFLAHAGNSLSSFRYFNKRPLTIISNHLVTVLAIKDDVPIGYGHLDRDNGCVWLGVAVADFMRGKGYGKIIVECLLKRAIENGVNEVTLSVDKNNLAAINLYCHFGFVKTDVTNLKTQIMKLNL